MKLFELHLFYNFLKKHNARETYGFNLIASHNNARFLSLIEPNCAIFYAFNWGRTEQGHVYWSKLNTEWHSFLKKYNI